MCKWPMAQFHGYHNFLRRMYHCTIAIHSQQFRTLPPPRPRLFCCVSRNSFLSILFSICKVTRNILIFFVHRTSLTLANTLKIYFRKTFVWYHIYVTLLHNRSILLLHHPRQCLLHPTPLCLLFNGLKGEWQVHILQRLGSQCHRLVFRLRA